MFHKLALNSHSPPCFIPTHRSCHLTLASTPAVIVSDRKAPGKLTSHWEVILKVIAAETLWRGSATQRMVFWNQQRGWQWCVCLCVCGGVVAMPSVLSCNLTSMGGKTAAVSRFTYLCNSSAYVTISFYYNCLLLIWGDKFHLNLELLQSAPSAWCISFPLRLKIPHGT